MKPLKVFCCTFVTPSLRTLMKQRGNVLQEVSDEIGTLGSCVDKPFLFVFSGRSGDDFVKQDFLVD